MNLIKLEPCFYTPIIEFEVDGDVDLLNEKLLDDIYRLKNITKGCFKSNRGGWHSDVDFFSRKESSFVEMSQKIIKAILISTKKIAPKFDLKDQFLNLEGWININGAGDFNVPHTHPGYLWSGCYYVKVPKGEDGQSGILEFLDPRSNITSILSETSLCYVNKIKKNPVPGSMFIFPSYLNHWVYPNLSNEDRVSIAFNAKFSKK